MFIKFQTVQEYEMMNMFKLFFFISGNFYFSFVSTSLAYIFIPQKQKKNKNYLRLKINYNKYMNFTYWNCGMKK